MQSMEMIKAGEPYPLPVPGQEGVSLWYYTGYGLRSTARAVGVYLT